MNKDFGTIGEIPLAIDAAQIEMIFDLDEDVATAPAVTDSAAADVENSAIAESDVKLSEEITQHVAANEAHDQVWDSSLELGTLQSEQEVTQIATNELSLPAALCDDKLLEEIRSIPNKMGFKIGDVADMLGIKQYVLRYWESEFEVLKPKKAANNQRYYTKKDVENAYLIRKLLHRDRFSIEGARSAMKELKSFVKKESKKERDWSHLQDRIETLQDKIDNLIIDIQRTKQLFI